MTDSPSRRQVVVLTGMSGAGKTQALKSLEDLGFEAIDNIPLNMIPMVMSRVDEGPQKLALGVDVRSRNFSPETLLATLGEWRGQYGKALALVFMDCDDVTLQRRFTETRRKHPLAPGRPLMDGIELERSMLEPVRKEADDVINTTHFSIHDLKRYFRDHFGTKSDELLVFVTSFSFREGVPRDADMVLDARFLQNPHYVDELRPKTGKDKEVGEYIMRDAGFAPFFENISTLLTPLLPRYWEEGKSYFTIAIGCTGGRHRSVFLTEKLAGFLSGLGYKCGIRHRDLK